MKLYDSVGPNPRIVRMFMAEKDISIPKQTVDLRAGENRQAEHLKRNPHGQLPTLELDDGSYLSEITAICEYLEEKKPAPALIGSTPEERAECRMWTRRVDLNICEPLANGYPLRRRSEIFREPDPLRARGFPGLQNDRGEPSAMAERTDGGKGISCAASASRWRTSCSMAGSISAIRSASRLIRPTPISRHGLRVSLSGLR